MTRAWGKTLGGYIIAKEAAWLVMIVTFFAGLVWGFLIGILVVLYS